MISFTYYFHYFTEKNVISFNTSNTAHHNPVKSGALKNRLSSSQRGNKATLNVIDKAVISIEPSETAHMSNIRNHQNSSL